MQRSHPILAFFASLLLVQAPGCSRQPTDVSEEAEALKYLADYDGKVVATDEKGRVIKFDLEGSHVDDLAIDKIATLHMLRHLSLRDASVSDDAMQKLQANKRLAALGITGTRVTDQGLKNLAGIPSLRFVWVTTNEKLTKAGAAALRKALPGINVYIMNEPKASTKK
jgi:hypothetical protein